MREAINPPTVPQVEVLTSRKLSVRTLANPVTGTATVYISGGTWKEVVNYRATIDTSSHLLMVGSFTFDPQGTATIEIERNDLRFHDQGEKIQIVLDAEIPGIK